MDINKELANIFTGDYDESSDSQIEDEKQPEVKEEAKDDKEEQPKEVVKEEKATKTDEQDDVKKLQKRLDESKSWAHKKNIAYVNAKKKVNDFLSKLQTDEVLSEEDASKVMSYFDSSDEEIDTESSAENSFSTVKNKLDQEFAIFKKYAKIEDADEKYNSFFYFWPMFNAKEQEDLATYLQSESSDIAIDKIMLAGSELYDTMYKGAQKHGGVIDYVKSLNTTNAKLTDRIKELEAELANTTEKVYNRSVSSRVQEAQVNDSMSLNDIWRNG